MYLKSYKELNVWQKSIGLVKEIYKITTGFPKNEIYGLSIQRVESLLEEVQKMLNVMIRKLENK